MGSRFPAGQQSPPDGSSDLTIVRAAGIEPQMPDGTALAGPDRDLAETDRIRRRRPRSLLLLTRCRIGVRRWSRLSRRAVRALVAEQDGASALPDPARATLGEDVLHSIARRRAGGVLRSTSRRLSWMLGRTDRLRARRATLLARIAMIPGEHVAHPDGIHRTVAQTEADRDVHAARVDRERSQNSRKHNRLPRWFRYLPRVVLFFDFLLLLYFLSGITDVDWANPASPELAFAVGLAAMITLVSYGIFAFAGDRLRAHKDHSGKFPPDSLDWLTRLVVIACTAGIIILGLLMFSRMWSEVLLALGNGAKATAISVAAAVTAVSVLANLMVIAVHALDGSEETDRLAAFGAALRRPLTRRDRMQRRASRLEHRIAVRVRRAQRVEAAGRARAERPAAIADEAVRTARAIHQNAGSLSEAMISGLSRRSAEHRHLDPVTGAEAEALRLVSNHTGTDLSESGPDRSAGPGAMHPIPTPRPAPEP